MNDKHYYEYNYEIDKKLEEINKKKILELNKKFYKKHWIKNIKPNWEIVESYERQYETRVEYWKISKEWKDSWTKYSYDNFRDLRNKWMTVEEILKRERNIWLKNYWPNVIPDNIKIYLDNWIKEWMKIPLSKLWIQFWKTKSYFYRYKFYINSKIW